MNDVLFAFLLTLFAGLSTGVGSALSLLAKRTSTKFLSVSLGFSAGVMIYVSMVELLDQARVMLTFNLGSGSGQWLTVGAFFGGMLLIAVIDKLVPEEKNPHEVKNPASAAAAPPASALASAASGNGATLKSDNKLMRTGLLTAIAIAIHNFPEGLATFIAALNEPSIAIPVAFAIAIHNIPEGIAVSIPIYYATGSRKKAFWLSFLSGLSEPLGAIVGYLLLRPYLNDIVLGVVFAAVAGIMVFISFDELLPSSREYGEHHLSIYGLVGGMLVMAVSLILL